MRRNWWLAWVAVLGVSLGCGMMPEHPSSRHAAEHPKAARAAKPISLDDVAKAIEDYIKEDTQLKGGYFLIYDEKAKQPLLLTLDHVHRERLAQTAAETYFACSDFKTPEGKLYDIDFWIKEGPGGELKVTQAMIHKEAGKPRYNWVEEGGVWKRRPVSE